MKDLSKPKVTWLEVGEESEAQRIDNFLLRQLKGVPKSHVYRVLRSGEVRVNSGRVKPEYRLKIGDKVRVPPVRMRPPSRQARRLLDLALIYEDASLLVVDKASGIAVHGGSGVSLGVIESLRAARPEAKMLEHLRTAWTAILQGFSSSRKRSALVELHRMLLRWRSRENLCRRGQGVPARQQFNITEALHKYVNAKGSGVSRSRRRHGGGDSGKSARQRQWPERPQLRLMTGRTHQIRVHLAHAGFPVLGDDKYGDFELNRAVARQGVKRLFLHAQACFRASGEKPLKLESLPDDMMHFSAGEFW
jgi:23S rRNA pseudouridine955/2504/2580 synthase